MADADGWRSSIAHFRGTVVELMNGGCRAPGWFVCLCGDGGGSHFPFPSAPQAESLDVSYSLHLGLFDEF
jgi:hypothetical protein